MGDDSDFRKFKWYDGYSSSLQLFALGVAEIVLERCGVEFGVDGGDLLRAVVDGEGDHSEDSWRVGNWSLGVLDASGIPTPRDLMAVVEFIHGLNGRKRWSHSLAGDEGLQRREGRGTELKDR